MISFYAVLSVVILLVLDAVKGIFRTPDSWWIVPLLLIGFFIGLILLHLLIVAVSVIVVNPKSESEKGNKYYRFLVKITLPLLFKLCRVDVQVTGEDLVPENQRVMLICNHINDIDPAVIMRALPDLELGFIAKKEVYTLFPFVSKIMKKLYCLPIDRENNREAIKTIIKSVDLIKKDKASIGIFPEGYTSLDGELHEFRNGCFKIATKTKAPVVVCTLVNSEKCFKNLFKRKTTVYFDVLKVIPGEDVATMHTDEIGNIAHEIMKENLDKRKKENI
ncbi:MAG: 1-acyl-sn-glycerol-3-phosphate acyltransferase [Clostridia bacterium]|nr:1-acyl-sn-glycerol-3-phosphate acyltransferase [Clostridia bacterium]